MRKLTVLLSTCLLLALLAGCGASARGIAAVPEGAQLVYSCELAGESGRGVTYGSWLTQQGTAGNIVVEVVCTSGSAGNIKLEYGTANSGGSANLGKFSRGTVILEIEDFYAPGASYFFNIGSLNAFHGTLNIYYIPA